MQDKLVERYSAPVPRYTSYPTAPHFHEGIGNAQYGKWLQALPEGAALSLYVHIPYCDRLCWFCACHTKQTLKYAPVKGYLASLYREIDAVAEKLPETAKVTALHWGGGSPTMLEPDDVLALSAVLRSRFRFTDDAEISIEMDPNDLDEARLDALAEIGMTRASLGIQDFDPKVQKAINRIQTFAQTKSVVVGVRARGVKSVNCDVLYGLPYQTLQTVEATIKDVISLAPDRVALFGYAHVPWMKKHQTMIPEAALPDVGARFEQARYAADALIAAGYQALGIDHFARPDDLLAKAARAGTLRRNFQGYTDDRADALIGLGASSISQLPQGYVQNMPAQGDYKRMVETGGLAGMRGIALSDDDRMRAFVIERLMCDFAVDLNDLRTRFGTVAEAITIEARAFIAANPDQLARLESGVFSITKKGCPFARIIAAAFDAYLSNGKGRHSIAV